MAADADIRTVMVTGPSLGKDQEDLWEQYFENKKRSDGGDISENGIVWNEEQKCFFITFMESHVAKRVASKEHSLKGCPVQVQLWSPERFSSGQSAVEMQKDRVLVSGFPPGTTSDLLQNYLEFLLTVDVDSVKVNGNDRSALIIFEAPIEKIGSIHENFPCVAKSLDILVGREHEYLSVADTVIMQEEASTIIGVCVWGYDNDIRKSFRQNGPIFPELPVQCRLNLVEAREVIGYIIGVLGSIHFKDSVVNSFHGLIRIFIQLTLHCSNKAQSVILCFIRAWPCSPGILTICVMSMSV
ncbi:hypothetical protein ACOMHN_066595 [Nucella lapillus]